MENNKENKSKFFAQYYGQSVMTDGVIRKIKVNHNWNIEHPSFYLYLTPIYEISDEDAIEVAKIMSKDYSDKSEDIFESGFDLYGFRVWLNDIFNENEFSDSFNKQAVFATDYLRSKGYALPYMDLSVEDLINYGWIKLRTNGK